PLHFVAQFLLHVQDALWRRTNGSVIDVRDRRIQHPVIAHRVPELFSRHCMTLAENSRNFQEQTLNSVPQKLRCTAAKYSRAFLRHRKRTSECMHVLPCEVLSWYL